MRFIFIAQPPNLPAKWQVSSVVRAAAVNACANAAARSTYIGKHRSWSGLKNWLGAASSFKCWYCEEKIRRAPYDVDHFRPKLGVTVDGVWLAGHDGYYWLAYEWSNFRYSCQRCNRPEKSASAVLYGKSNEFPIQNEAQRCTLIAGALAAELPRMLDPCVKADCELLAHGIDGEVKPTAPVGSWDHQRARYTIDRLGLNEWNTPEEKRGRWQTLATLLAIVGNTGNPEVIAELNKHLSYEHEYASFFRSAIGTHRDKPWIENLL